MIFGTIAGTNFNDKSKTYTATVNSMTLYENTLETAIPQTEIYNIINDHLNDPLAEGKTEKKVMVIGYDGFNTGHGNMTIQERMTFVIVK